jgi:hypothetical protein
MMNVGLASNLSSISGTIGLERRKRPRIYHPFPATVQGTDIDGNPFKLDTAIDNLCADCLYFRLIPQVAAGATVNVLIRLSASVANVLTTPCVLLTGVVKRTDVLPGSVYGLAVSLSRYRLL